MGHRARCGTRRRLGRCSAGDATATGHLLFIRVPEPKHGKNGLHLDLLADDRDTEETRLTGLGAAAVASHEESGESWTIMRDPYGNEFCVN